MKQYIIRFLRLNLGLFLYALGIVVIINAQIGYAPWDAFHVGLGKTFGISIGTASILTGIVIGIITIILGEKLGIGTILNMVLIGLFLDIIMAFHIIPVLDNMFLGIIMVIAGMFIISLASYFYIESGFGAGPRDSLMVAITRLTGFKIGICRGSIELVAALVGWALGGMIGIGTVISAFAIGFCIQTTFKVLKFDATAIKHETMDVTYKNLVVIFKDMFSKKETFNENEVAENQAES